ncbi:MAG: diaminopimelate epimerase [Pseudonocardiaceae bacterium]
MDQGVEFLKGHGTENDFILLPDPTGSLDLTPSRIRALCDRRRGLGADGVLRVVPGALVHDVPPGTSPDDWFMDYRNADGSVAEMCGNGARVFARYLADAGLVTDPEFRIGSRSGSRTVRRNDDGSVAVEMGRVRRKGKSTVTVEGAALRGLVVDVGNPHVVCLTEVPVEHLDLTVPPGHDPGAFPRGVNVEFVNVLSATQLRMRVHERGVGETRSCGTGTVAALAAALDAQRRDTGEADVQMPGGLVHVAIAEDGSTLAGPAVLVAAGRLAPDWWSAH